MNQVTTQKTTLTLPTYPIGAPSINPIVSEYRKEKPYPYQMYDELTDKKVDAAYEALIIENDYLRLTVLPALGGKLYSAFDKRNNEEMFYRNRVVKPQLVGLTGAWTSGGIEFNFPFGHRPSTMELIESSVVSNADGSGSIHVGEVDKISGVRFHVELRLEPGKAYIEQVVTIHNPTPLPQRFFFWNTASYPETDSLECRYPARWIIDEGDRSRKPWPYDGDVDVRWSRNIRKFSSIFTSFLDDDFFGVYDAATDRGNIHVARHREVPGKKFWSWGNSELGKQWNVSLTDEDGPYMEHQAGNIETQNEYRYLLPYQKSTWKEYWIQPIDTGPFTYADRHMVVTANFAKSGEDRYRAKLAVRANASYTGASIKLLHDGDVLHDLSRDLDPEHTLRYETDVEARHLTQGWLKLQLWDADGELLSEYTIRRSRTAAEEAEEPADIYPDEDLSSKLAEIAHTEERLLFDRTLKLYDELLDSHPLYLEAYVRKAVVQLKMLRVDGAAETIEAALKLMPYSDEVLYYAGLVRYMQGKFARAKQHLLQVVDTSVQAAASNVLLGKIALQNGDPYRAADYFRLAQKYDGADTADVLEAYALRKLGQENRARSKLSGIVKRDPLNGWALAELDLIDGTNRRQLVVRDDIYNAIQIVQDYEDLGDLESGEAALQGFPNGEEHPLILYHLGFLAARRGDREAALAYYSAAESKRPDRVFPMLPVTMEALKDAAALLGEQAMHTLYYLGLAFNARERFEEAVDMWKRCAAKGMNYSVLYRNLGFYYMRRGEDDQAMAVLEQGLPLSPRNADIAVFLNSLYKRNGKADKRISLIDEAAPIAELDQMSARLMISIWNDAGAFDKSLDLLKRYTFRNWEIEYVSDVNLRQLYQDARLGKAKQLIGEERWQEAVQELEEALSYPANLQLGKRWDQSFAKEYYLLALCHERMGDFRKAIHYCDQVIAERLSPDSDAYGEYVKAVHKKSELEWLGF